ncbi:MAG: pilus assembly PilX family protein [Pseudomonas sp.]
MRPEPSERGFALVAALFVMVIIALVVIAMARLSANQHGTNSLTIQQVRAYQAARAGLEWGIAQATATPPNCAANQAVSLAGSNLAEFGVQVSCTSTPYSENDAALTIYQLTATATNGNPATRPDYAYRQLTATVN